MNARDLMTTSLVVVPPEMPVASVAQLLAGRGISAVPVADADGRLLGLVTEGDLIRRLADQPRGPLGWFLGLFGDSRKLADRFAKAHGATAADVMTRNLVTVAEDAGADTIAGLMETHGIRRVPVLRDGQLVGLVSRADLLRAILAPPAPAPSAPALPPSAEAAAATDAGVLRQVIAAMREQPWTDTFYVYPDVTDGKVTFHGYHRSAEVQRGLEVLARGVPGVTAVEDRTTPMPFFLRASL